jgi:hypothetical protein
MALRDGTDSITQRLRHVEVDLSAPPACIELKSVAGPKRTATGTVELLSHRRNPVPKGEMRCGHPPDADRAE